MSINPFSYGKPIDDPQRFIGRRREVEQIYSRLLSAFESTSIVGERRIGKTSLLKYLTQPDVQAQFGVKPDKYIFIYQDFQLLDENTVPTRFWKRVLRAVKGGVETHADIAAQIDAVLNDDTIDNYALDDIFTLIDEQGLYIVLLLDEFENVTRNQNFDNAFFGGVRALAIHHHLALITSSRQSLVELTHSEEVRSSPFFNIFATVNLRAFTEEEATELIDKYLAGTDTKFLLSELNVVFALASYHPHFLQIACHHLFAAHEQGLDSPARSRYITDQVHNEAAPLFVDYWRDSDPGQQILLTILALRELERGGGDDTADDLSKFYTRVEQVLPDLERRALITKNSQTSAYHLFSTELREWIADEIFGQVQDLRAWRDWQKDESLIGTLPVALQETLAQVVQGLNPAYQTTLGNWLLEPTTVEASLQLVKTCLNRYEHYKETRQERAPAVTMADEEKPVGDTPKGLFDRLNTYLKDGPPPAAVPASATADTPAAPIPAATAPPEEEATPTGRLLRRVKKKAAISPTAVKGLIISSIVPGLNLESTDRDFVTGELDWLFSAIDNLFKICQGENDRQQAVAVSIPQDAQHSTEANNRLLTTIDDSIHASWASWLETRLDWMNSWFKELDILLGQEASRGPAGKSDLELQNKIKSKRLEIVQALAEMAQLMNQAYGILVTVPDQLVQLLEE